MLQDLLYDFITLVLQLVLIGVIGGAVSWYYTMMQKRKELQLSLLAQFSSLYGKFVALRYCSNSFYIEWEKNRGVGTHPLNEEEMRQERWKFYEEACQLIGEYQALKPSLILSFPAARSQINQLQHYYQDWRRNIGKGEPILQEKDGQTTEKYRQFVSCYKDVIGLLRKKL